MKDRLPAIVLLIATILPIFLITPTVTPLHHVFINDFLMAIFFLLIGLELKEEIFIGHLSTKKKLALPLFSAIGGVIFPAIIFFCFNFSNKNNLSGIAIPCATDIAFGYAIISFFIKKISQETRATLISIAVLDDVFAIFIIAIFYSNNLQVLYILYSLLPLGFLAFFCKKKYNNIFLYLVFGLILWAFIFKSGVHPTIAGVALAMFIPLNLSTFRSLKKILPPVINFLILPIFAFTNISFEATELSLAIFSDALVLGIIFGLFFGKQLGVMLFGFIFTKLKLCNPPKSWIEFYVVAIFAGVGFTMSLFISNLAFDQDFLFEKAKIAILLGSLFSALYGIFIASLLLKKK
jgi:NhaA family Na+:H+ antiporter